MGKNRSNQRSNRLSSGRGSGSGSSSARHAGLKVVLYIPDCHIPNHHEACWSLMLEVARFIKPSKIVILGDFADAETLSAHGATKPVTRDFNDELAVVRSCLDELDALGAKEKFYISGNHEFRLERYLMAQAPAIFRSMQWPMLLGLDARNWQWVPYKKSVRIGKIRVTHDTGSAGMNAHRQSAKDIGGSAIIGHTHRMAYEVTGRFDGVAYLAAMFGWLGDPETAGDYTHEVKSAAWVHGFGIGYEEESGVTHVQPVPIVGGRCVVEGVLFE